MGYDYEIIWQGKHVSLVKEKGSSHNHRGHTSYIPMQVRLAVNHDLADRRSYHPMRAMLQLGDQHDLKGETYEEREGRRWNKELLAQAQARAERADALYEEAVLALDTAQKADEAAHVLGRMLHEATQEAERNLLYLASDLDRTDDAPAPGTLSDLEVAANRYRAAAHAEKDHDERAITNATEVVVALYKNRVLGLCPVCKEPAEAGYPDGLCGRDWEGRALARAG